METNLVKTMNATEGMQLITDMIKVGYIADKLVERHGNTKRYYQSLISTGVNGSTWGYKEFVFPDTLVDSFRDIVKELGVLLLDVEITFDNQLVDKYPLCYGNDFVSKFKVLRKVINLPYLFETLMGRTTRWQKMHLSDKAEKYYNTFTDSELQEINNAIRTIALTLCSIKLTYVGDNDNANLNDNPNPNQDIPLPPYEFDFDNTADYYKAYDAWETKYHPTQEQQKELMAQLLRQIDMDNEEALS